MNPTIDLLMSHRTIRAFKDVPVSDEHVSLAVRAGQMASTSSAVQAYCLIRVRSAESRAQIAEWCGPQDKVKDSGAFFVVCGDSRRHRLACERDGLSYDQRLEAFLVAAIDASLFAEKMVIAFESLGYGICYIGGLRNNVQQVDELLGLPEGVYPLYGLCVGVPAEDPVTRPRLPASSVLFEERYPDDEQVLAELESYDETYSQYLKERGAAKTDGWSSRMAQSFARVSRPHLAGFYESKSGRLD